MTEGLSKKVKQAVRLLQSYKGTEPIEVCYSGGKDSDVILELAKMAGIRGGAGLQKIPGGVF